MSALEVIVLTNGRSGTRSLNGLVNNLYRINDVNKRSQHESNGFELFRAIKKMHLTGDDAGVKKVFQSWEHQVEVADGYQFCIPQLLEVFGPGLKVIHLKRDRAGYIKSAAQRVTANPQNWGGYAEGCDVWQIERPTAVDTGEMSLEDWSRLDLVERLAWYYDKTHATIEDQLTEFESHFTLTTDELNDPAIVSSLGQFISPDLVCATHAPHLNKLSQVDYKDLSREEIRDFESQYIFFDWKEAAKAPNYALDYHVAKEIERLHHDTSDSTALHLQRVVDQINSALAALKTDLSKAS